MPFHNVNAIGRAAIPESLPDEYANSIYRLVQEALNNGVRQSGAKNAHVGLEAV